MVWKDYVMDDKVDELMKPTEPAALTCVHECKCVCHTTLVLHDKLCCSVCENCEAKIIDGKMKEHEEICHAFTILDELK